MRSIDDAFTDDDSLKISTLQSTIKRHLQYSAIEDYVEKEMALTYSTGTQKAELKATMDYIKSKFLLEDYQIERYKRNLPYKRNNQR